MKSSSLLSLLLAGLLLISLTTACNHQHHHHHHQSAEQQQQYDYHEAAEEEEEEDHRRHLLALRTTQWMNTNNDDHENDQVSVRIGSKLWPNLQAFREAGGRCGLAPPSEVEVQKSSRVVLDWLKSKRLKNTFNDDDDDANNRNGRLGGIFSFRKNEQANREDQGGNEVLPMEMITVPTVFHVITDYDGFGGFAKDLVPAQVDVMNQAFRSAGFQFEVKDTTVTMNNDWYYNILNEEMGEFLTYDMQATLRKGDEDTLNVYLLSPGDGTLGWSSFPWWLESRGLYQDGIVIWNESMPGAISENANFPYNHGKTLVHEIGHWLGLFHTFEGVGCVGDGDGIDDTPAQRRPSFGCPERKNSCPFRRGNDAIQNFMDYTDDECMSEFSPQQITRMNAMWEIYRSPNAERNNENMVIPNP